MAAYTGARLPLHPAVIVAGALTGAIAAGTAMTFSGQLGIALTVALCFVPVALLNLRLAVVLWLPTLSLLSVAALDVGPSLAGIMILFAWLGAFATRHSDVPAMVIYHRRLLVAVAALVLWALVSIAWAVRPQIGGEVFFGWLVAGVIVLVISTVLTDRQYLRLAAGAFVVGAVVSVVIGLVGGSVQTSADPSEAIAARVGGGSGDPNFLAAGLVPAIVLAFALAAGSRRLAVRWAVLPTVTLLVVGLMASQSRGGLVAAVVAAAASLVVAKRGRVWVVVGLLWVLGAAIAWYATDPAAWKRISNFNESSGRSELWAVGWRMWQDNPVVGVGLQGFVDNSGSYARELGPLRYAQFITEQDLVVHNSFLELLAETGVVGLTLYLSVVVIALHCAWRAAGRFERLGDMAMASLSRAVIVGALAMLTAAFFISSQTDRRLWVLLALGPALLAASRRGADSPIDAADLIETGPIRTRPVVRIADARQGAHPNVTP